MCAHGSFLYLEAMSGIEGEIIAREDKLGKLDKELSGYKGVGWALVKEVSQRRVTMGLGDIGVEGSETVAMMGMGGGAETE